MGNQAVDLIKAGHVIAFRYHYGDWSYAEDLLDGVKVPDDSPLKQAIFEAYDDDLITKGTGYDIDSLTTECLYVLTESEVSDDE